MFKAIHLCEFFKGNISKVLFSFSLSFLNILTPSLGRTRSKFFQNGKGIQSKRNLGGVTHRPHTPVGNPCQTSKILPLQILSLFYLATLTSLDAISN